MGEGAGDVEDGAAPGLGAFELGLGFAFGGFNRSGVVVVVGRGALHTLSSRRGSRPHPNPPCQARGRLSQRERGLMDGPQPSPTKRSARASEGGVEAVKGGW